MAFISRAALSALPSRLARLYGRSLYAALLVLVAGGLAIPAVVGGYLMIGVQEQQAARRELDETLQRNADILALGMQESLWNMNIDAARSLVDSLMRDPAVVRVHVGAQAEGDFIDRRAAAAPAGHVLRAEREVVVHGQPIGHVTVEMDDSLSQQSLRAKQVRYALVLAVQLGVSLLLILMLLRRRLLAPLGTLMSFSDHLSRGQFDAPLALSTNDELGRLGGQLEHMRIAIGDLFQDIARREERFRTIVTQVPGAVFRARPGGLIDFVSDAIEDISGYPAARFIGAHTDRWADVICPEDRKMQRHFVKEAVLAVRPYEIEYRITDAAGIERWVLESGQPVGFDDNAAFWIDGIISDISERKYNEMRIEALLAEQGAVLDNVMFGIMYVRERRVVSTNRRFDELFGYGEGELLGDPIGVLFPTVEDYVQGIEVAEPVLARGGDFGDERQFRRRDGSLVWCTVSGRALDPERQDDGSIWVFADITERRQTEEKLRLSATVLEHIADGVMVIDLHGKIVATNPAFTQITGYTESEAVGTHSSLTRLASHDAGFSETLWADLAETGFWRGELRNRRKNGETYLEWLTVSAVRDDADAVTHYVCVFSDITKVKESQDKLDHLAHHDPLTGLPNRLLFHDRLQHAMVRAARNNRELAVMFIDLDRFKTVNDTLGHHIGDELLKQVAGQLAECLRDGDTLARLGGDEFIVLLEDVDGARGARLVAEKLMQLFERPVLVSDYELFVTGSVGISLFPQDAADMNMLIRNADVAMYHAKARGRNGYQLYAPSMDGDGAERLRMEGLLRRAIERGEIRLHYQPQVEIETGRLIGVEALVRWHSAELGHVPPARFIPLAEDIGFICQLGAWVLEQACRQVVCWEKAGLYVPKVAVNLSGRQFDRGSVAPLVACALAGTGLAPQRLQLEVTESVIMNTGDALQYINDLHALGVELAIDDFGTGYSSLAYLKQLPVQTLKIDRSFIKDIPADKDDEAIAVAIVQLGKSMDLAVIAEGVETAEQAAFLLRHGCRRAQGYLYGRPVEPAELLETWRQDDAGHGRTRFG
ncbi:diguanylate cyclase [Massilia sp. Root133]|uniref:sensor domain-containing protein n=1 Tax=unclassified Massilia TaxID=2609279 RepID=UPI0006F73B14|nr:MULTISPECIES: bifunctional diguanylate cyclase/phosphodiesterase [unclassified Massilia]KQY11943.1 diguanylate cyclase [Massilia sp. Root133]KQZ34492.1 diguanylate cyclase [Massilia sp. Root1485]